MREREGEREKYIYIYVFIGALVISRRITTICLYFWDIVVVVEPFCLDEGRSLYRVEYLVATAIIRIIFDICVCLFWCCYIYSP